MGKLRFTLATFIDRYGNPADYQSFYKGKAITRVENAGNLTSLYRIWLKGQRDTIVIPGSAEIEVMQ